MAKETSLTTLTRRLCQNAFLAGALVSLSYIAFGKLLDPSMLGDSACWIAISITFAGCWLIPSIWRSNREMRAYAELRGMVPNARSLEAEILPYGGLIAFFIGVGTFVSIIGIDRLITTEMQKWGIVFCAGIALVFSIISAVYHRQFVKRIEDTLNAEENGWRTFHRWPPEVFKEFL